VVLWENFSIAVRGTVGKVEGSEVICTTIGGTVGAVVDESARELVGRAVGDVVGDSVDGIVGEAVGSTIGDAVDKVVVLEDGSSVVLML
jgi:hypothetical protein